MPCSSSTPRRICARRLESLVEAAERAIADAADADDDFVDGPADEEFGEVDLDEGAFDLDDAVQNGSAEPLGDESETDPNERTYSARAERAPIRVGVKVKGPTGKALSGRTRDLSPTGLLVSVDGEELPVGRDVRVEFTHPTTRAVIEIPGKVVRHIESEGVVPAVAISLLPGASAPTSSASSPK